MPDPRNIQGALHGRDWRHRTAESFHATQRTAWFRLSTVGPGTCKPKRCDFPCAFVEEPDVSTGFSLAEGDAIIGIAPRATALPIRWVRSPQGLYVGADISVRVRGHRRQRMTVRIAFSGLGLATPLGSMLTATSTTSNMEL